jgi:hypothetical protein
MFFLLFFKSISALVVYWANHTGHHRFTLRSNDTFAVATDTPGLEVQILIEADLETTPGVFLDLPSPPYSQNLSLPFLLFSPDSLPAMVALKTTLPSVNISAWTINRSLCQSVSSVFFSGDGARFRVNYMGDFMSTRCFFQLLEVRNLTVDYWVYANPRFGDPFIGVYTAGNITTGRGPWINQTQGISKVQVREPVFFTATGVHGSSQLALNVNFSATNPELANVCQFQRSPIWNGTRLINPVEPNFGYLEKCNGSGGSETMWMYLAYAFVADASLVVITVIAWLAFRHWQRQGARLLVSLKPHERRGVHTSVDSFDGYR